MSTRKASDRRLTPEYILDCVRAYAGGPIALDPCSEEDNPTKALDWRTSNGLADDNWADMVFYAATGAFVCRRESPLIPVAWANPPFSNRGPWDEKAIATAMAGVPTFVFANYEASSNVTRLNTHAVARCDIRRRVKCVDPETGKAMDVGRQGSVWLLGGELTRFATCFGGLGQVVPLDIVRSLTALGASRVAEVAE